eukprot:Awhi_evm1s7504
MIAATTATTVTASTSKNDIVLTTTTTTPSANATIASKLSRIESSSCSENENDNECDFSVNDTDSDNSILDTTATTASATAASAPPVSVSFPVIPRKPSGSTGHNFPLPRNSAIGYILKGFANRLSSERESFEEYSFDQKTREDDDTDGDCSLRTFQLLLEDDSLFESIQNEFHKKSDDHLSMLIDDVVNDNDNFWNEDPTEDVSFSLSPSISPPPNKNREFMDSVIGDMGEFWNDDFDSASFKPLLPEPTTKSVKTSSKRKKSASASASSTSSTTSLLSSILPIATTTSKTTTPSPPPTTTSTTTSTTTTSTTTITTIKTATTATVTTTATMTMTTTTMTTTTPAVSAIASITSPSPSPSSIASKSSDTAPLTFTPSPAHVRTTSAPTVGVDISNMCISPVVPRKQSVTKKHSVTASVNLNYEDHTNYDYVDTPTTLRTEEPVYYQNNRRHVIYESVDSMHLSHMKMANFTSSNQTSDNSSISDEDLNPILPNYLPDAPVLESVLGGESNTSSSPYTSSNLEAGTLADVGLNKNGGDCDAHFNNDSSKEEGEERKDMANYNAFENETITDGSNCSDLIYATSLSLITAAEITKVTTAPITSHEESNGTIDGTITNYAGDSINNSENDDENTSIKNELATNSQEPLYDEVPTGTTLFKVNTSNSKDNNDCLDENDYDEVPKSSSSPTTHATASLIATESVYDEVPRRVSGGQCENSQDLVNEFRNDDGNEVIYDEVPPSQKFPEQHHHHHHHHHHLQPNAREESLYDEIPKAAGQRLAVNEEALYDEIPQKTNVSSGMNRLTIFDGAQSSDDCESLYDHVNSPNTPRQDPFATRKKPIDGEGDIGAAMNIAFPSLLEGVPRATRSESLRCQPVGNSFEAEKEEDLYQYGASPTDPKRPTRHSLNSAFSNSIISSQDLPALPTGQKTKAIKAQVSASKTAPSSPTTNPLPDTRKRINSESRKPSGSKQAANRGRNFSPVLDHSPSIGKNLNKQLSNASSSSTSAIAAPAANGPSSATMDNNEINNNNSTNNNNNNKKFTPVLNYASSVHHRNRKNTINGCSLSTPRSATTTTTTVTICTATIPTTETTTDATTDTKIRSTKVTTTTTTTTKTIVTDLSLDNSANNFSPVLEYSPSLTRNKRAQQQPVKVKSLVNEMEKRSPRGVLKSTRDK